MAVKGLREVQAWLKAKGKEFENEVREIVEVNIGDMELQAIRDAPGPGDRVDTRYGSVSQANVVRGRGWSPISQSIGSEITKGGMAGIVFVNDTAGDIAAWIEFGTGQSASAYLSSVDPQWRDIAKQYYIDGKGTIINRPYLYPAYIKYRTQFLNELKDLAKNFK